MATRKESKQSLDSNDSLEEPSSTNNVLSNIPEAKWIKIYLNGDEYFPGIKCVINNKHHRNFDVFLNYITQRLQPSFGAVRNIYSPVSGHRITNLEDLQPNHGYVAAGSERFKRIEAGYAQTKNIKKVIVHKPTPKIRPIFRSRNKPSNIRKSSAEVTIIYVFKNGDDFTPPLKFVLRKRDFIYWDKTLESIGKKIQLSSGYVKKLCTLEGQDIKNPEELINRQNYVAVGANEHFKYGKYVTEKLPVSTKPSSVKNKSPPSVTGVQAKTVNKIIQNSNENIIENDIKFIQDNSEQIIEENNNSNAVQKSELKLKKNELETKTNKSNCIEGYFIGTGDGIFKAQQQKLLSTITEINLDEDRSGLFRASERSEIINGAKEIQDSPDTLVDLPEDEMEAEEIDDEITPEMERAMQDLDLEDSQIVAFVPSFQNKTSVTPTKQLMRTSTGLHSQLQNTFV